MDVQNDFCHPNGFFSQNFGLDVSGIDPVVEQIRKVLTHWRAMGRSIIWTKALGDPSYLSATQLERYAKMEKLGFLQDGTWGADFYRIAPLAQEAIFKKGGYDPFVNAEFKARLQIEKEIMLVGFFSDVCIDATARTADSLGIKTNVIGECSLPILYQYEDSLRFMQTYYGTRVWAIEETLTQ